MPARSRLPNGLAASEARRATHNAESTFFALQRMVPVLRVVFASALLMCAIARGSVITFRGPRLRLHESSEISTYRPSTVTCTRAPGPAFVYEPWTCRDDNMPTHLEFDRKWTRVTCPSSIGGAVVDCYLEYAIKDKEASAKAVVTGTRKRAAVPIGDVLANRIIIGGSVCLFVLVSLIVFTSLRRRRLKFAVNLQDANAVRPGRVAPVLAPQPDALATTGPHWHARQMPPPPPAYDEAVKV